MYRIAHISDLHLVAPDLQIEHRLLQRAVAAWAEVLGLKIEANPYSLQRLNALRIAIRELQPNAIFVTGDITNYGDKKSMCYAKTVIEDIRRDAGTHPFTFVVPGNHDTLTERSAALDRDDSLLARLARRLRHVNAELDITHRLSKHLLTPVNPGEAPAFLSTFWAEIPAKYRPVDPSEPQFLDMRWGEAAVFLFNSNVDDTFMANAGSIGGRDGRAYHALHSALTRPRVRGAIKVALLHHHPISAPQALDSAVVRAYNWMEDGPLVLQYLNQQNFTLVAHGHQHCPFVCSIDYTNTDERPLHIVAAGSATQADGPASFNVIDFLSPFELRVHRFEYAHPFFQPDKNAWCRLPVRSANTIRLTAKGEPEIAEDGAVRNLVKASDESYDADIAYDLFDYRVTITEQQRYIADYRRVGKVRGRAGDKGTIFVITGSPAMKHQEMNISAISGQDAAAIEANWELLTDHPTRKVIRVSPKGKALSIADAFDVTLHFEWQASVTEPNDFDGFNFMNLRHDLGRFRYRIEFPWQAARWAVKEYVLELRDTECTPEADLKTNPGSTILTIDFSKPKPVVYLIYFGKELRSWTA